MKIHFSQFLDALLSYAPIQVLTGLYLSLLGGIPTLLEWNTKIQLQLPSAVQSKEGLLFGLLLLSIFYLVTAYIFVLNHLKFSSSNTEVVRELIADVFKVIRNRPNISNDNLQAINYSVTQVKNKGYLSVYGEDLIHRVYKQMCNVQTSNAEAESSHLTEKALAENNLLRNNASSMLDELELELSTYKIRLHNA